MKQSALFFMALLFFAPFHGVSAQGKNCDVNDTLCLFNIVETEAAKITEGRWRDHAYRDLAVSKAVSADYDGAVALIARINNPDTQAMTIRAIGMAIAIHQNLSDDTYRMVFAKLDKAAETITNEGAKDIAYTYIAMAEAFAGLDADAAKTMSNMKNSALKYKAYAETAEIQAGRGDFKAAMASINAIHSLSFKNKALGVISSIFTKQKKYDEALNAAQSITNPTQKAEAVQLLINHRQNLVKDQ